MARRRNVAMALLAICIWRHSGLAAACVVEQNAPAKLKAAVYEYEDRWSHGSVGAATQLAEAGFEVQLLNLAKPANELDVDLIVFGSFVSGDSNYRRYIDEHGASLAPFVEAGGVLVQFTQADQTERNPPFLPEGMSARRSDRDVAPVLVRDQNHRLVKHFPMSRSIPPQISLPPTFGKPLCWEGFGESSGFEIILSIEPDHLVQALLDGRHGNGRIILVAMALDKIERPDGTTVVDDVFVRGAQAFFKGLHELVRDVKNAASAANGDDENPAA